MLTAAPAFDSLARTRAERLEDALPLPPPLTGLLPEGVLRRGTTVQVARSTSLLLALLAEASGAGAWCAAVALPSLGVAAAAGAGLDLDRFAMVPAPGESWSTVVAALLDALDVVVVAPPARVSASLARRLSARARERRGVLLVVGDQHRWEGADAVLDVTGCRWHGVGDGHGHLRDRELDVRATGRRVGGRPRAATLRLTPSGAVAGSTDNAISTYLEDRASLGASTDTALSTDVEDRAVGATSTSARHPAGATSTTARHPVGTTSASARHPVGATSASARHPAGVPGAP